MQRPRRLSPCPHLPSPRTMKCNQRSVRPPADVSLPSLVLTSSSPFRPCSLFLFPKPNCPRVYSKIAYILNLPFDRETEHSSFSSSTLYVFFYHRSGAFSNNAYVSTSVIYATHPLTPQSVAVPSIFTIYLPHQRSSGSLSPLRAFCDRHNPSNPSLSVKDINSHKHFRNCRLPILPYCAAMCYILTVNSSTTSISNVLASNQQVISSTSFILLTAAKLPL